MQGACLRSDGGLLRAEIALKDFQRQAARRRVGDHERIVIAWDGENRRGIIAVRIIKLVVVVARFAEIVDHVAQLVEERGPIGLIGRLAIGGQLIGDAQFVAEFPFV